MPDEVATMTLGTSSNSIGAKATTVALATAHTASFDGLMEVQIKISSAEAKLQVSVYDGTNTDTGYLNGGVNLLVDTIYGPGDLSMIQKAGYTYTFSMVFSTGTPSCDMLQVAEFDMRGAK